MNFLSSLISGKKDEKAHSVMNRYGRGTFDGPAAEGSVTTRSLKISGSYLYVPILAEVLANKAETDLKISGNIISQDDIQERIEDHGVEVSDVRKWRGYRYKISGELSPEDFMDLHSDLWDVAVLTKAKTKGFSLSPKSSVPKPKKFSDPSFCKLRMPLSDDNKIEAFKAVAPGAEPQTFEELSVSHLFEINDLVIPEELKGQPASVIRVKAKRKGVITREITVDGQRTEESFNFVA